MKTMVHRSNIHCSKINQQRKLKKAYKISSGTAKNDTLQAPSLAFHLKRWARYFQHRHAIKLFEN